MNYFDNLIWFPWNSLYLSGIFLYIAIGIFYVSILSCIILSRSTRIRYISFTYYFTYVILFAWNISCSFVFLRYAALPVLIFSTLIFFKIMKKELNKIRKEEFLGGRCCNSKYRKQQIRDFKMKSAQEQQEYQEYCTSHPKKLKPLPLVIVSVILPIVITLCLWRSGIGYRLYGYPLVQPLYG